MHLPGVDQVAAVPSLTFLVGVDAVHLHLRRCDTSP
jgi:hypothetical protein